MIAAEAEAGAQFARILAVVVVTCVEVVTSRTLLVMAGATPAEAEMMVYIPAAELCKIGMLGVEVVQPDTVEVAAAETFPVVAVVEATDKARARESHTHYSGTAGEVGEHSQIAPACVFGPAAQMRTLRQSYSYRLHHFQPLDEKANYPWKILLICPLY